MAGKADFTPEKWGKTLPSMALAGLTVSAAERLSGLLRTLKEGTASARSLLQAKAVPGADDLIKAAIAKFETSEGLAVAREGATGSAPAHVAEKATAALRQVSFLLNARAPADSIAFKRWLHHIAASVAGAPKQGGLLGFGGVRVNEAEKASLTEISTALNLLAGA